MILLAETIESCKNMRRSEGSGIHVREWLCPEDGFALHWVPDEAKPYSDTDHGFLIENR